MQRQTAVIALVLAVGLPTVASANGQLVRFAGCPRPGVESSCMTVRSGPRTYNISTAMPKVRLNGRGIVGHGFVTGGISTCMQGIPLRGISYAYTRQRCPIGVH